MALFLAIKITCVCGLCVWVCSCNVLPLMSFLCWKRMMGNGISLYRIVWLFKVRQRNKRSRLGRESEIVRDLSHMFTCQWGFFCTVVIATAAHCICVLHACVHVCVWDKGINSACHQCSLELAPQLLVAMRPYRHILRYNDKSYLLKLKSLNRFGTLSLRLCQDKWPLLLCIPLNVKYKSFQK